MNKLTFLAPAVLITLFSSCGTTHTPIHFPFKRSPKVLSTEQGLASWYSVRTNRGTTTASGRRLNDEAYTTAHRTLPMGSKIRVTNLNNGKSEILTVTDRGPFTRGRVVDVTIGSSKRLGFYSGGLTKVKVELLERGNWKYQRS